MSADPVTMMIISGAIQAAGTYSEIQESKRQSKLEQREYELNAQANNLKVFNLIVLIFCYSSRIWLSRW